MAKLGLQVVLKSFYSPIPDLRTIPESIWERENALAGIHFDLEEQLSYLDELRPYLSEFRPMEQASGDTDKFFLITARTAAWTQTFSMRSCEPRSRTESSSFEYSAFDPYQAGSRP